MWSVCKVHLHHLVITLTNADLLLIGCSRTNFIEIVMIKKNSFRELDLKLSSAK